MNTVKPENHAIHGKTTDQDEQKTRNTRKRLQNTMANNAQKMGKELTILTECAILKVRTFC